MMSGMSRMVGAALMRRQVSSPPMPGHQQIEQDAVDRLHGEQLERLLAGAGEHDVVAGPRAATRQAPAGRFRCRRPRGSSSAPCRLAAPWRPRCVPALRSIAASRARTTIDVVLLPARRRPPRRRGRAARHRRLASRSAAGTACGAARRRAGCGG